jgi:hypothetical protein
MTGQFSFELTNYPSILNTGRVFGAFESTSRSGEVSIVESGPQITSMIMLPIV